MFVLEFAMRITQYYLPIVAFVLTWDIILSEKDPYHVLGLQRSASAHHIKSTYKKLARQWHPDKNSNPDAQEKFVEINWAYEILSDDVKRQRYDRFGIVDDNQNQQTGGHAGFHHFQRGHNHFHSFPFGNNGGNYDAFSNKKRLTLHYYVNSVLPNSYEKAFLIYAYGEWCFECVRFASVWDTVAAEMESIGIETAQMNADLDNSLSVKLGIRRYPSIYAIVRGRIVRYKKSLNAISLNRIKDFIAAQLPIGIVSTVTSDSSVDFFMSGFKINHPQVLLFTAKTHIPLLFLLVAFEYHERVSFGYVNTKDVKTTSLRNRYNITVASPSVLILKEEPSVPVLMLQGSKLKQGVLRDSVRNNLYLDLPRISSPLVFDDLCPVSHLSSIRLCVVLFTSSKEEHSGYRYQLRTMAKNHLWKDKHVQFFYVNKDVQTEFVNSFHGGTDLDNCGKDTALKLAVLFRQSEDTIWYEWYQGGWCQNENHAGQLKEELEVMLVNIIDKKSKLRQSTKLGLIKLENGPSTLQNILEQAHNIIQYAVDTFDTSSWHPSSVGSFVFLLALLFIVSIVLPIVSDQPKTKSMPANNAKPSDNNLVLGMVKLSETNQKVLINNSKPGCLTVVLLLDANDMSSVAKSPLMQAFADLTYSYTWNSSYSFCWLSINEQLVWCTDVMDVKKFGEVTSGTVLAINGHRKYLYIFKPKTLFNPNEMNADFLGLEESDDDSIASKEQLRKRVELVAKQLRRDLPTWLERLYEGTLGDKKTMDHWPPMSS